MGKGLRRVAAGAGAALLLIAAGAFAAEEKVYETGDVVVTGTRTPRGVGESAGSVVVIGRREIEAAATPDLKKILEQVPGLSINDSGVPAGVATASIRGSRSTQVLVLLDGVRLANAQSSFFNLNDLPVPLDLVERIEVVPLTASSLYGADALGGVINIITRPPGSDARGALSLGGGSYGELRGAGSVQAGVGPAALRAAGQVRSGDGHRDNSDYDLENASFGARTEISAMTVDLALDWFRREGGSPGHVEFATPEANQKDETAYFRLTGDYRPGGPWVAEGTVFVDSQEREYVDPTFGEDSRHRNRKGGVDLQGSFDQDTWGLWTAGGEWIRDDVDSDNVGERDSNRWALFIQDEWGKGPWSVVGTVRYDDHSVYGSEVNPRLLVMRSLPRQWRLWASGARGYRAPNFDDLYWKGGFGVGNPDLQPETSRDLEGGGEKRWGTAGRLRLVAFYRDVTDLIQWTDPDGDFVFSPENISSARIWGVEADGEYAPRPWMSIPFGYQYLDPEDSDTGEKLDGQIKHLLQAAIRLHSRGFSGGLEAYYTDRYGTATKEEWSYTVVAATLGWKGKAGKVPLKASVRFDNLLDEEYETVEGFPMPGRRVYAEAGVSF